MSQSKTILGASAAGWKLKTWRRMNNLTQAQAAARMGVARRTWNKWERGSFVPGPLLMAKLVQMTGHAVEPNDFYQLAAACKDRQAA